MPVGSADMMWVLPALLLATILLGPSSPVVVLILFLRCCALVKLRRLMPAHDIGMALGIPTAWWLCGHHSFLASGHRADFNSLQIASAYIGLDQFNFFWSGLLLFVNTFATPTIHVLALRAVSKSREVTDAHVGDGEGYKDNAATYAFTGAVHMLWWAVSTCGVMIAAFVHRRHLFVWAIFAPRFAFMAFMGTMLNMCVATAIACSRDGGGM